MAKISTLTDDFATQISPAKWAVTGSAVWNAGRAAITDQTSLVYSMIQSQSAYDLTASSCYVKMTPPVPDLKREVGLNLYVDTSNELNFIYATGANILYMRHRQAGTNNQTSVAYEPANMIYLRIRMSGTDVYWETSPDGSTWTIRRTYSGTTLNLTAVKIQLYCGQWGSIGATSTAYFDNLNTLGVPAGPSWSVWNGTTEAAATVKVWNGTSEVATTTEIAP